MDTKRGKTNNLLFLNVGSRMEKIRIRRDKHPRIRKTGNWLTKQKNSAHLLALGSENPELLRECLLLLGGLNTAPHRQHS
jgi:hypothetical protein